MYVLFLINLNFAGVWSARRVKDDENIYVPLNEKHPNKFRKCGIDVELNAIYFTQLKADMLNNANLVYTLPGKLIESSIMNE